MTNQERIKAIHSFGYSEREAGFLCLVALHGGYFLRRQFVAYVGHPPGGATEDFIKKAIRKGHVRAHSTNGHMLIYHLYSRPFFDAIGEEDNRNRRWRQPFAVRVKLMTLDFVLANRQHEYFATESEKVAYFIQLGIGGSSLPIRFYQSKDRRATSQRFFVDKFPIYLSGAPDAPSPVVHFGFIDGSDRKPCGFDTHLMHYRGLFSQLPSFHLVYVSTDPRTFFKAERIFRRICGALNEAVSTIDPDRHRVLAHFKVRERWEKRQLSGFDKAQLDTLRDELHEFRGPEYDALYNGWLVQGDGAVLAVRRSCKPSAGSFSTYHIDQDYSFLIEPLRVEVA